MTTTPPTSASNRSGLRSAILVVALANLAYVGVEFAMARRIGSVSLFADSIDFLEDALVNLLIVFALGWKQIWRARLGFVLAAVLFLPAFATLGTAWQKLLHPLPPDPWLLSITGLGALVVNISCAFLLARFRHHRGSLVQAAVRSARNDALANIAIITAGLITSVWLSGWPDLIVGIGIAILNADAAKAVLEEARNEHRGPQP